MTAGTEDLMPELLRGIRADMDRRLMAIEMRLEGWRHVFVATTGSPVTRMKGHETRIAAREGARV